jgi:hypothetical protein
LSEVIRVGDASVLGLSLGSRLTGTLDWSSISITSHSFLFLGLGHSFTSLLVVEFGFALICTPTSVGLLLGFAKKVSKFALV